MFTISALTMAIVLSFGIGAGVVSKTDMPTKPATVEAIYCQENLDMSNVTNGKYCEGRAGEVVVID